MTAKTRVSFAAMTLAFAVACGSSGRSGGSTGGSSNNTGGTAGTTSNTGGNAGTKPSTGGGGAGGAVTDECVGKGTVADGSKPLIDDLEDGDVRIIKAENRAGSWWWSADTTCTNVTPSTTAVVPSKPPAGDVSKFAMHVTASACTQWGANTGFSFNEQAMDTAGTVFRSCAYDASAYDGMSFWAIGKGVTLHVVVATRQTIPIASGGDGTCVANVTDKTQCYDGFAHDFPLTDTWAEYSFAWAGTDLKQGGWGATATWDPKQLTQISFGIGKSVTADYAIDDPRFYKGTVDKTPPAPGAGGAGTGGGANAGAGGK